MLPEWKTVLIILLSVLFLWRKTTCGLWNKKLESGIKIELCNITVLFEGELRKDHLSNKRPKEDGAFKQEHEFEHTCHFPDTRRPNILCTTLISALLPNKIRKLDSYCLIR